MTIDECIGKAEHSAGYGSAESAQAWALIAIAKALASIATNLGPLATHAV